MNRTALNWGAALLLAIVFTAAAIPKLSDPAGFALAIHRYHLAPDGLINLMAIYLPWLEVIAALALLWPRTRAAGAWLITLMLILFTVALTSALARGLDVACGCFTTNPEAAHAGVVNVVRNLGLLLAALWLVWPHRSRGDV